MKVIVRLQPILKKTHPKNMSDVSALVSVSLGLSVSLEPSGLLMLKLLMFDHSDAAPCMTSLRTPTNPL